MAKRRKKEGEPSFDSLLDTMTNVVGILVIMLVVTLLGVREAVQRIKWKLPDISQMELDQLRALMLTQQEKLQQNEVKLEDLQKLLAEISKLEKEIAELEKPSTAADLQQRLLASDKTLEELRKQLQELQATIKKNDEEIVKLRQQLAALPKVNPQGTKIIRMPNPRSPPAGSTPIWFVCHDNRIAQMDQDALIELALKRIVASKNLLVERQGGKIAKISWQDSRTHQLLSEIEGWIFAAEDTERYFESRDIGDRQFRLTLEVKNFNETLMAEMRKGAGESPRDLEAQLSDYRRIVREFDKEKHYARFIVYPDSFEVYVRAREMMEERGIPAGWMLYFQDKYPILSNFGLHFVGEEPPKPPPAQPAAPAKPAKPVAPAQILD